VDARLAEPVGRADHLGHDDDDHRDREGHPEAGEEVGASGRHHGAAEHLPAGGAHVERRPHQDPLDGRAAGVGVTTIGY
jgi:hypothetical protein